jgi:thiol-disulfide isomerase/thioredoxin
VRICLLLLALLYCSSILAEDAALDLELPLLDGSRFFRLTELQGRAIILNLWDIDCPPCVHELPLLNRIAVDHPQVSVIGISLSPLNVQHTQDFLAGHPAAYTQLRGMHDPSALLRRLKNPLGSLPHTAVLHSDHTLCRVHNGEVNLEWLETTLQHCMK